MSGPLRGRDFPPADIMVRPDDGLPVEQPIAAARTSALPAMRLVRTRLVGETGRTLASER